ncbi:MAG: NYN domain-containing protein [Deltaproteobacteria bacterium]|nr:NYN domain-containing protein [Deltaproteobacteria bacterium]
MHLIIDGYNLIRQSQELQLLDARELEAGRQALLARLAIYRERSHHKITVVFDGWLGGNLKESRDRQAGILIIYSRRGEKADEVIKRLLTAERQRAVVVTSDREIQSWAQEAGATWITAPQFEMQYLLAPEGEPGEEPETAGSRRSKKGPAHRLPKGERRRRQRLKKL